MADKNEGKQGAKWISIRALTLFIFTLVGIFNLIIFLGVLITFWRPDVVPVPITSDVAIGLHLQLFEAFLAALAIGLAVFGFAGYAAIKDAAERRADQTAREVMQAYSMGGNSRAKEEVTIPQEPDLAGLPEDGGKPEPEKDI